MPRFAILIHDHPFLHWDLLVEQAGVLRSWRLLECPDRWLLATRPITLSAEAIPDHRLAYLDYEGPVSRERGSVQRWDSGRVEWLEQSEQMIRLKLEGKRLQGMLMLTQPDDAQLWRAVFDGRMANASFHS